ncbi:MAG: glutamate--tRNA ligase [Actinomycetota bacterium]|nr:glutamate--tRNA ligase [Actinomycetota bacterium]
MLDFSGESLRVRFAPSPTGKLHLGSARTALLNWLVVRREGGKFVLRLEDTDVVRSSPEFEQDIIDSLKWMGIDWDEGPDIGGPFAPYRQSERMDLYREQVSRLLEEGKAYRCFCSPDELEERKRKVVAQGKPWRYDRKCLEIPQEESERLAASKPFAIRFRVPEGKVVVKDLLRGEVVVDSSEIADFIILRSDGRAGFNMAVVVDDITMKVNLVIRGDDHLTNAVRHAMLFEALDSAPPLFLHHSLLLGKDGAKLSKRHAATAVSDYRERGYLSSALANYLSLLSWSPGDDREIFTMEELVSEFNLKRLSASRAIFDIDKLNWINRQHMKKLSNDSLAGLVRPFIEKAGEKELQKIPPEKFELAVESVREKIETLSEAVEQLLIYTKKPDEITDKALEELRKTSDLDEVFDICLEALRENPGSSRDVAERIVKGLREEAKARGWGAKKILWVLRLGITGHVIGPDLIYLIMFWGSEGCAERMEAKRRIHELH